MQEEVLVVLAVCYRCLESFEVCTDAFMPSFYVAVVEGGREDFCHEMALGVSDGWISWLCFGCADSGRCD